MAKVTIPRLRVGEAITHTQINSFTSSLVGLNGNINDDNVAIEGIDRRNLVKRSVQDTSHRNNNHFFSGTDLTIPSGTALQNVLTSSGQFVVIGNPLFDCTEGDTVLVHCSFHLSMEGQRSTGASPSAYQPEQLMLTQVALYATNQAASPMIEIPGSFRSFRSALFHQNPTRLAATKMSCTIVVAFQVPKNFVNVGALNGMNILLRGRTSYTNVPNPSSAPLSKANDLHLFARVIKN